MSAEVESVARRVFDRQIVGVRAQIASAGLRGDGDPEGSVTGEFRGQTYARASGGNALYVFEGVAGANTGWVGK